MPNWTKDELIAYILLYAANANFKEENKERNVIISKVDMQTFQKIHDEFEKDNDYQSINKMISGLEQHEYSNQDLSMLFNDIKIMFLSDGNFDSIEQSVFLFLKKVLT